MPSWHLICIENSKIVAEKWSLGQELSFRITLIVSTQKNIPYRPFLAGGRKSKIEVVFTHGPIFNCAEVGTTVMTASNRCRGRALWIGSIHTYCCP